MTDRKLIVLSLKWYDIRIHQGVLNYAKGRNWDVVANQHMSDAIEIPDAHGQIVMLGPNDQRRIRLLKEANVPAVDVARFSSLDLPRVCPDNEKAGALAANEFLKRGFSRFAVFSTQSHWYVEERLNGFRQTVEKNGFTCDHWHLPHPDLRDNPADPTETTGKRTLRKWLSESEKPLAVYAIEDERAAMLLRACRELELAVPEQVAIIGNNNDPVICPYTEISLSSVDLNWEGVGFEAAKRLDLLMQGKKLRQQLHLVAPKGVEVRKSSESIAVDDLRVAKALSYIQENCQRHITVLEIAKTLDVPLRTLQWAFQKELDCSIQDEISRRRIEQIQSMLLDTDKKIGQIATELGFSSAQYLNHFFTKSTGITPLEYRQNARGKNQGAT